jgi:hypothetical protein
MTRHALDAEEAAQEIRETLRDYPDHAYELVDDRAWLASKEVDYEQVPQAI